MNAPDKITRRVRWNWKCPQIISMFVLIPGVVGAIYTELTSPPEVFPDHPFVVSPT